MNKRSESCHIVNALIRSHSKFGGGRQWAGIFTSNGISMIQVQTSSQTNFENVSGIGGLGDGSSVSLRGLLFESTPNPVLIADKVRKR